MARFEVSGADALISGLWDMVESLPQLRDEILEAEADVIEAHINRSFSGGDLVNTGKLSQSIERRKFKSTIRIGPTGEHHTYVNRSGLAIRLSSGRLGYIHEYGLPRRGIRARKWMTKALDNGKSEAYAAAEKVYDTFLKKHNL